MYPVFKWRALTRTLRRGGAPNPQMQLICIPLGRHERRSVSLAASADFEISADPARIDIDVVHRFLTKSHWAQGRSRRVVERCIRNSLCFGAYTAGRQIAFARAITDRAVFAYLADVFVLPEFRGRGIAKELIRAVLAHP